MSVENAFALVELGNKNNESVLLLLHYLFEVFEERKWMQKLLRICKQNVVFAQANQHIRLNRRATIEEEAFSTLIEPKSSPFEVGKWTMR